MRPFHRSNKSPPSPHTHVHVPSGDSSPPTSHFPLLPLSWPRSIVLFSPSRQTQLTVCYFLPLFCLFSLIIIPSLSDTAISSENPITDRRTSIASNSLNSSTSPSQARNNPWSFPSHPSPSSLSSPSPYPSHSNHPSPAHSAHSPPNMIGSTPAFYDPDVDAQPQTQDYHEWANTYQQPQLALTSSSSYPHQHPTTDPHPESHAQPTPQRQDRYQFVNQPPPSTSPDATDFPYFPSFVDSSNSLSQAMHPQGWSPESSIYSHGPTSNNAYLPNMISQQYSAPSITTQAQHQHQTQPAEPVPGLAATPISASLSPASANALPSPGSSNTGPRTVLVHPNTRRGAKSTPSKPRKRQKPESDDDDDDDVLSAGIDTSASRPNPNRL